jgi:hypothetical protein
MRASDDMEVDDIASVENILAQMLKTEDIEMKTEIRDPHALAGLWIVAQRLDNAGLPKCGQLIREWIEKDLLYMVSYDRKRAQEIIQAVTDTIKHNRTITQTMMGPPPGER